MGNHKQKRKLSDRIITIILVAVLLIGLSVLLYPGFSDWWNSRVMSQAVSSYNKVSRNMTEEEREAFLTKAREYNEQLYELGSAAALANPDKLVGYEDILNFAGDGIMGYVSIDRLNIQLPVYHGTEANVLILGAGHLQGSSFPVGGENTHSVISAHRGLPSALLFTDLDKMEEGDLFSVTVLDETYYYEVDQIRIILPTEYENLYIESGEDHCTLMTCTPYGINTHRLLVRGVRTDAPLHIRVDADAYRINALLAAPVIAAPMLVILFIGMLVRTRKIKKDR